MRSARWSIPNAMLAGVLALALCSGGTVFGGGVFSRAWADEAEEAQRAVDDAQATLDDAEAHMESIAGDYDALKQDVEELQARVDEISAQAMDAQQAVIEGRAALGKTAVHEYTNGGASQSLVTMVLEARSFSDLIRNLTYLDSIMQFHADEVDAQKERSVKYEKLIDDLNFQKDEQEKKLEELEAKRAEAETVLSEASSKLSNAQSDQAARLEALRQKAEELAAADGATGRSSTRMRIPSAARTWSIPTPVQPNPDPDPPAPTPAPSPEPAPEPAPDPGISWSTGIASAYGGSTDPYTPNPGTTANGSVCDDNSMGVAIPMSWPNFRSYFGRTVEISYNGQTVLATVNDCGGMGGGSRSLDLQPGVWKAFGYSSCQAWGLRTVNYRFL
ncbi:MAG: coiled-coil domain-containing protein [Eggerthellaceae bacterium]